MKFRECAVCAVVGLVVVAFTLCLCGSIGLFDTEVESYGFTATVVEKSVSSFLGNDHYWIYFIDGEDSGVVEVTKSEFHNLEINDFVNISARVIERFFNGSENVFYTKG